MTVKLTMCGKIFKKFWCYTLFLLVVPSSQSEQSVRSNEEKNDNFRIQYEPDNMTSTTNYGDKMKTLSNDLYEKSTINIQYDNMQYESRITSMSNDNDSIRYKHTPVHNQMDNKQISMEFQTNSNANYERSHLFDDPNNTRYITIITYVSLHIVSVLILVSIFLIYSVLTDFRNIHTFMLCNYSGTLSVAYTMDIVNILIKLKDATYFIYTIDFFNILFYSTSFFWLNIMSFDIWWTFREFCSLQGNIRHREKKKLIYYSICAWSVSFIIAIIYTRIIVNASKHFAPEDYLNQFLLLSSDTKENKMFILFLYGIKSIYIIGSICLLIFAAVKIARFGKDIGHRLTDSEGKRYNDNKNWLNLYLQLFIILLIVIGMKLSMIAASTENSLTYILYIYSMDIIQNFCTFILFVRKKKTKLMLLKFGCDIFS